MKTRVKIDGRLYTYDLDRVRSWHYLKAGDRVLLRAKYTHNLSIGEVVGIVAGCMTVEIPDRDGEFDYEMIESKNLYSRVYRINL